MIENSQQPQTDRLELLAAIYTASLLVLDAPNISSPCQ